MCFALITDRRVGLAGLNYDRIFIKHCLWKKKKKKYRWTSLKSERNFKKV